MPIGPMIEAKKYPLPPHGRDLSAMVEGRTTTVSIEISDGIIFQILTKMA